MIPEDSRRILETARTVAVVGWSTRPERPSHWIADYLEKEAGYTVWRINPGAAPGTPKQPVFPDLASLPAPPDVVDVFRSPPHVPEVVEAAIAAGARAVWLQPGAENEEAAARARAAGLRAVVGRCMYRDHKAWREAGGGDGASRGAPPASS